MIQMIMNYPYSYNRAEKNVGNNLDIQQNNVKGKGEEKQERVQQKSNSQDCETCKNRKYVDNSDENVSFKSPTNISPSASYTAVRSHEQEHVSNAFGKAEQKNGKVINVSVTLQTGVCSECGRTYIAGGVTHTQIKYYNESNPYQQDKKLADSTLYKGMNVDLVA